MSELTNYIKERIKELEEMKKTNPDYTIIINEIISELQAVLSKIEELEKSQESLDKDHKSL